jgi:hypothetical protein
MNTITFQNVYQTSATSNPFKLGQRGQTPDGRQWVFAKASSALAKGSVAVPAAVTAVDTVSSSTDALGRIIYITKASAGWTVGQFEDAIGVVDDGTGAGQTFKVQTNTADTLVLYPETALATALAVADSDITLRTMALVVKSAITSPLQSAVGIAQVAFSAGDYGWLLTEGDGAVLAGEALTVGANFTTGDDTTGQVIKGITAKGPFDAQSLGFCLVANAAADQTALVRVEIRG